MMTHKREMNPECKPVIGRNVFDKSFSEFSITKCFFGFSESTVATPSGQGLTKHSLPIGF